MKFGRLALLLMLPGAICAQVGLVEAAIAGGIVGSAFPAREPAVIPGVLYELPDGERFRAFHALPGGGLRVASRTNEDPAIERVLMPDAAMVMTLAPGCAALHARAGEGVLMRCGETAYFHHAATGRVFSFHFTGETLRAWLGEGSVYIARPAGGGSWQIEPDGSAWRTEVSPPEPRTPVPERLRLGEKGLQLERRDGKGLATLLSPGRAESLAHYGWVGEKWVWVQRSGSVLLYDPERGKRVQTLSGRFGESDQPTLVPLWLANGDRGFAYPKGSDRLMWVTGSGGSQGGYARLEFTPAPGVVLDAPSAPAPASAPDAPPLSPANWPVPEGWKTETIPFPLEFAPEIKHVGTEELRFAPGMFKPDQPGYWSYGFVWWVEEKEFQGPDDLAVELRDYFRGLLVAVAKEKKLALDPEKIIVSVRALRMKDHEGWRPMAGEAEIFDAFGDGRPLKLTLWVYQRDYAEQGRRAVLVLASPAPAGAPIWKDLNDLRDSFPR